MWRWLAFVMLCVGCNPHVYSPPAGLIPLEHAGTVGAGQNSLGADVSGYISLTGPSVMGVRAFYRRGIGEQFELTTAPSMIIVVNHGSGDSNPNIYAVRSALKYVPANGVGISLGLGAGTSAAGAFVSPDLGASFSIDNLSVIPFAVVRGFLSAPIHAKPVHFTVMENNGPEESYEETRYSLAPRVSFGYQLGAGLRFKLHGEDATVRPALPCGIGLIRIFDSRANERVVGAGCGLEVAF